MEEVSKIEKAFSVASLKKQYGNLDLSGKYAVVVGGTSGIGRGIAVRLAQANVSVVVVGRNEENGNEVVKEMKSNAPNADVPFSFIKCDAKELVNVRDFADNYLQDHNQLDFLVLTQGIATVEGRTETKEGLDQKLSLHFYSRMAFIKRLLKLLQATPNAKVLSVFSAGVHSSYASYQDDTELKNNYTLKNAADAAGSYNDLGLDAFSREFPSVAFIHTAPGMVNTNWGTEMPWLLKGVIRVIQPVLGKSIYDCAELMCQPLFDPNLTGGFHLRGESAQTVKATSIHTDDAVQFIWKHINEVLARIWKE